MSFICSGCKQEKTGTNSKPVNAWHTESKNYNGEQMHTLCDECNNFRCCECGRHLAGAPTGCITFASGRFDDSVYCPDCAYIDGEKALYTFLDENFDDEDAPEEKRKSMIQKGINEWNKEKVTSFDFKETYDEYMYYRREYGL